MHRYVWDLHEVDQTQVAIVGGKGAALGELSRIGGVRVPPGFCVTTDAYRRIVAEAPAFEALLERLARAKAGDRQAIRTLSAEIRHTLEQVAVPDDLAAAIVRPVAQLGEHVACAVRSSATAEDLPSASFAGQHDSHLNLVGADAILTHVRRCWASLFTERAVTYRMRNGVDHRTVRMAVVVQQMIVPRVSGVLFTADPVTGHRKIASVEATAGLGEALVGGRVNAEVYAVRGSEVRGDTGPDSALTEAQVLRLVQVGRRIEAHFGRPQDIEWCLVDDTFHIVQSRPITTLFPVPGAEDRERHVYVSVGHQQMMTDPLRPLGLSLFQLTAGRPMAEAGGRLFVDVTRALGSPGTRAGLLEVLGRSDPLIRDALQTLIDRGDFVPAAPDDPGAAASAPPAPLEADPSVVTELIARTEASLAALERDIRTKSGAALLEFVQADLQELKRLLFDPQAMRVILAAADATAWLNDQLEAWLGERGAADALAQSVPHNVTSEMGLALLDVADAIRPHPEVVAFLRRLDGGPLLDGLAELPGGPQAREAIVAFLERYGMRCVGEIDITRPRWIEQPDALVPVLLGHVDHFEPGEARRRTQRGLREARDRAQALVERVRALPDGAQRAAQVERQIERLRTFTGFREFPKYSMVRRYLVYKRALMAEAARLVRAGLLRDEADIFYLTIQELQEVLRTERVDMRRIRQRKDAFVSYRSLTPPRVSTSDGEVLTGSYRRDDVPAGALVGLAVSAGIAEGRARVVPDLAEAELEPGDILVTAFTDPSWTPVFVTIGGLVTEVGGRMTHGAVIAREYGLPAVVGVEQATQRIRDGQRIRVDGAAGIVELLD